MELVDFLYPRLQLPLRALGFDEGSRHGAPAMVLEGDRHVGASVHLQIDPRPPGVRGWVRWTFTISLPLLRSDFWWMDDFDVTAFGGFGSVIWQSGSGAVVLEDPQLGAQGLLTPRTDDRERAATTAAESVEAVCRDTLGPFLVRFASCQELAGLVSDDHARREAAPHWRVYAFHPSISVELRARCG
jgi:hypothetical protein